MSKNHPLNEVYSSLVMASLMHLFLVGFTTASLTCWIHAGRSTLSYTELLTSTTNELPVHSRLSAPCGTPYILISTLLIRFLYNCSWSPHFILYTSQSTRLHWNICWVTTFLVLLLLGQLALRVSLWILQKLQILLASSWASFLLPSLIFHLYISVSIYIMIPPLLHIDYTDSEIDVH